MESQYLFGHGRGELLAPAAPRQRLVVQEQQRPGGVALQTAGVDLGLEVQHDPLVAEADAEVLQAPVPTTGLRQDVVELIAVNGRSVTGRAPKRGFAAPGTMIVDEHPPVRDRVAERHGPGRNRALMEVVPLALDTLQPSGLVVAVLLAHEHLDLCGESQKRPLR